MVDIKEFNISDNGAYINISASVKEDSAYQNVYLKSVWLNTEDNFVLGSSEGNIYKKDLFNYEESDPISLNLGTNISLATKGEEGTTSTTSVNANKCSYLIDLNIGEEVVVTPSQATEYYISTIEVGTTSNTCTIVAKNKSYKATAKCKILVSLFGADGLPFNIEDDTEKVTIKGYPKKFEDSISIFELLEPSLSDCKEDLFFVTFETIGTVSSEVPCGQDEVYTIGVTYYRAGIYNQAMSLLRELDSCNPPQNLINWFLKLKMLDICIYTGHYKEAAQYWKDFYKCKIESIPNKCGCHG